MSQARQGAYPGTDDDRSPFLSLHLSGTVFQSTFSWPVFAELRRRLRARQDGDRTRSYQGGMFYPYVIHLHMYHIYTCNTLAYT